MPLRKISLREQLLIMPGRKLISVAFKLLPEMTLEQVPSKWGNAVEWRASYKEHFAQRPSQYEAVRNLLITLTPSR